MTIPTSWTAQGTTPTGWSNAYYIIDLGVTMNDTGYLMNDTVATMNDQMINPIYAAPITWTEQ